MKKRTLILLTALTAATSMPTLSPILESNLIIQVAAQEAATQKQVAVGASLDADQTAQTLSLLGANDVAESEILRIDGSQIHTYLNDGSNNATPVFSSAMIEQREAGYGVQVQIITPDNILLVAPQTYQNAAITAGAKDVLIKIAAVTPVTGEGALTGVYAIYEASGRQLSQASIQVAQKEIEVVNKVQEVEGISEELVNQLQNKIKQSVSLAVQESPELSEEAITELVQAEIQKFSEENTISLSEETITELLTLAIEFSKTETASDSETTDQIEASVGDNWTMPQAIDYFEASLIDTDFNEENYDRSYWTEVSNEGGTIVLHLRNAGSGGNYYEFSKSGSVTIITLYAGNASYPDNPTVTYWVRNSDHVMYQEHDYFTDTLTEYREDGTIIESQAPDYSNNNPSQNSDLWNADKASELAAFMETWGTSMGQGYKSYTMENPGTMYGPSFPNEIMTNLAVNDVAAPNFWSQDGLENGEYAIVAAYADYESIEKYERFPNYYLFAIKDGQPIVLFSQQNQGQPDGLTHFNPTANAELQAGFEAIVWN